MSPDAASRSVSEHTFTRQAKKRNPWCAEPGLLCPTPPLHRHSFLVAGYGLPLDAFARLLETSPQLLLQGEVHRAGCVILWFKVCATAAACLSASMTTAGRRQRHNMLAKQQAPQGTHMQRRLLGCLPPQTTASALRHPRRASGGRTRTSSSASSVRPLSANSNQFT